MKKNNVFTIVNSLPLKQIQSNHRERPHAIVQTKKHSLRGLHTLNTLPRESDKRVPPSRQHKKNEYQTSHFAQPPMHPISTARPRKMRIQKMKKSSHQINLVLWFQANPKSKLLDPTPSCYLFISQNTSSPLDFIVLHNPFFFSIKKSGHGISLQSIN